MTYRKILQHGTKILAKTSSTPLLDSEVILAHVTRSNRTKILSHLDTNLTTRRCHKFFKLLAARRCGKPVAYILGEKEFYGQNFLVDQRVLVPRPETEMLVEIAVKFINEKLPYLASVLVLDLCTGSGVVAISIKKELPQSQVWATDISKPALQVAKKNSRKHHVHIHFCHGDLFSGLPPRLHHQFNIIVVNPPYLTKSEYTANNNLWFEPRQALIPMGYQNSFAIINNILSGCALWLKKNGSIKVAVEIGHKHSEHAMLAAKKIFSLPNYCIKLHHDLAGIYRVITITRN